MVREECLTEPTEITEKVFILSVLLSVQIVSRRKDFSRRDPPAPSLRERGRAGAEIAK
jgi:hypothetical protein